MPSDQLGQRPGERWGALVVRVWLRNDDAGNSFRAHVSASLDVARSGDPAVVAANSIDQVATAVRDWAERFVTDAAVTPTRQPAQQGGDSDAGLYLPVAPEPKRGAVDAQFHDPTQS